MNGRHQKELRFVVPVYYHVIKLPVSTKYTQRKNVYVVVQLYQ